MKSCKYYSAALFPSNARIDTASIRAFWPRCRLSQLRGMEIRPYTIHSYHKSSVNPVFFDFLLI